ncbi:hypothetical protein PV355_09970 [Streptomyces stelliscabiei]|uniref:hypothetical protein n=1 Tax=Streptomyces stelliscabiei TaxID=146820 RepID=UPI0029BD798F|nr:hypothetical protein [Streptomyces stelliscabiei]MDX2515466.1 hypothetical protein [Streptomyces stelliscabiei]
MSGSGKPGGDHLALGRDQMIAALLREREGYVRYGRTDRVRAVDEQLMLYGYDPEAGFEPPRQPTAGEQAVARQEQDAERERQKRVRALLEERAQLTDRQGRAVQAPRDRVALVDEQLAHYGYDGGSAA